MDEAISPEPLLELGTGYWTSKAFLTACNLKLFSLVEAGNDTLDRLAPALALPERGTRYLLDGMTGLGLLHKAEGRYRTAPVASAYLVEGKPGYMGGLFVTLDRHFFAPFADLEEALRGDRPVWPLDPRGHRVPLTPEQSELFTRGMHGLTSGTGAAFGREWAHRLSGRRHLLDLGGGSGAMSIGAVGHTPGLRATVLDRPVPCAVAREYIAAAGLTDRVDTLDSDMFGNPLPAGPDVHLYSNVLQNHGTERCLGLLQKSFDALPPGGAVVIAEFVLDAGRASPPFPAAFNFLALVVTDGGGTRTYDDYRSWLEGAGFVGIGRQHLLGPTTLVFGTKPDREHRSSSAT